MTANSRSELAAQIKVRIPLAEAVRHYGFEPNRAGFIPCPFHQGDNTPSLKLYPDGRGWYCFGCHKHGTVIDFVMELFHITFSQALVRLDVDFGLGLTGAQPDPVQMQAAAKRQQAQTERKRHREEYDRKWEQMIELTRDIDRALDCVGEWVEERNKVDQWLNEHQHWSGKEMKPNGTDGKAV